MGRSIELSPVCFYFNPLLELILFKQTYPYPLFNHQLGTCVFTMVVITNYACFVYPS